MRALLLPGMIVFFLSVLTFSPVSPPCYSRSHTTQTAQSAWPLHLPISFFRAFHTQVICEEALSYTTCAREQTIDTPVDGYPVTGTVVDQSNIVAVSIIRAADSMLDSFMHVVPEASIGKVC